jgi:hypothetical protein
METTVGAEGLFVLGFAGRACAESILINGRRDIVKMTQINLRTTHHLLDSRLLL